MSKNNLTISPTDISTIKLFNRGTEIETAAHADKEHTKHGTLRGGNSGALINGDVYGKCHRTSLARFIGYQIKPSPESHNYFDAGYASEDTFVAKLTKSWIEELGGGLKCEEDIPVAWKLPDNNIMVTGRPDIVLFKDEKPVLGLELKAILAINSSLGVAFEGKPKVEHMIQAAHYSWQMQLPWSLVYAWNVKGNVPYWAKKKLNIQEKDVTPGKREFHLGWEDGRLYYVTGTGKRVDTVVTQQSIEDYYSLIADMADKKTLYRPYANKDLDGSTLPFAHETYCKYCQAAEQSSDFSEWTDRLQVLCDEAE